MLGGGLILRAGTPSQLASTDAIAWLLQQKDLSIGERSVFAFSATPQGLRIEGFSISGQNGSDQPLTGVEGIIKTDVPRPDLKLALIVDRPEGGDVAEAQAGEARATDVIPPQAPFKLVFAFPTEAGQDGVTPEEVLATFGGLMLLRTRPPQLVSMRSSKRKTRLLLLNGLTGSTTKRSPPARSASISKATVTSPVP